MKNKVMKTRNFASVTVLVAGIAGTLTLLWRAVRFCKGEVGAPLVDQAIAVANLLVKLLYPAISNGDPPPGEIMFDLIGQAFYYLFGIAAWLLIAAIALRSSIAIARIVAVGFRQYCAEVSAARAEDARRARITSARKRRLELRKQREEPQSGGALSAAAIGTLFGFLMIFLSGGGR